MRHDPLIDTMAGNYRLVARLGAGGMGEVYKGVHGAIGSKVAIKLLHATAARDKSLQERFLLEAKAVNRIEHPGVVKVIDAGRTDGGRPFLVMELLDGASLHELRKAGKLTIADACNAMVDVLDAVAAAHAAGVIHRDLKPANLFRTHDGRTVVLDFGVAKLMADVPVRLTLTGSAVGTPHYMAPEQIRGQPVTPLVDIYAAGVVLFELLCGRRPFDNIDDESVMAGHLERRPPPPRALEPAIPVAVQDLILAALQKDPAKRPRSALAMRDALRAVTIGVPHTPVAEPSSASMPTLAASPSAKAPRAHASRWRSFALAGAALFALVGVILIVYAARRSRSDIAASAPSVAKPTVPVDAPSATCAQLVTVDPVGVADDQHAAVQAAFFQRCAEDRWDGAVTHCFITVTTVVDLARCVGALTLEQRSRLEAALNTQPRIAQSIGDEKSLVSIQSYPSGATITIDGVVLGKTPWAGQLLNESTHVEFSLAGYKPRTSPFDVRAERPNVLKVVLLRDRRPPPTTTDDDAPM